MKGSSRLRRFFRDLSIRRKLMTIILLTCGMVLVLATLALAVQQALSIRREAERNLAIQAQVIAGNVTAAIAFRDRRSAAETLAGLRANPRVFDAAIVTPGGAVFARHLPAREGRDPTVGALAPVPLYEERASPWGLTGELRVVRPISLDDQELGTLVLRSDATEVSERIGWLLAVLTVTSLAGFVLAYLLSARLQELISQPVQQLAEAITAVAAHRDYGVRVEVASGDELGELAAGFNAMLGAIQARDRELEEAYRFTRAILDAMAEPVSIVDLEDLTVADANAAFLARAGERREEARDRAHPELIPARAGAGSNAEGGLLDLLRSGRSTSTEIVQQQGGEERVCQVSFSPIRDAGGRVGQVVRVEHDVTERKRSEEALQAAHRKLAASNDELLQINEEVKNFAYIVSHDLRAPLVSIKGFSGELQASILELVPLLERCRGALAEPEQRNLRRIVDEDVREALSFIGSSVNRMDALINSILNLSRVGRRELRPVAVDVNEVARGILASLAHQIDQRQVKVTVADLPPVVADRVSLEQIIGNLVDNALKYLEPGRAGEVELCAEAGAEATVFRVRDNGRGIAREDLHKVFELFRRVGKQDVPGEGMGLAYVKTLVRRHGGRIWCDSTPGAGSTFSFSLPAAPSIRA